MRKRTKHGEAKAFFESLKETPEDHRECIEWPFAKNNGRYGKIHVNGRFASVHRELLVCKTGVDHKDMHAAHNCGNHMCVNVHHVRWATPEENMLDKRRHGTARFRISQTTKPGEAARFFEMLKRTPEDHEECIDWPFRKNNYYGRARIKDKAKGRRSVYIHRELLVFKTGVDHKEKQAAHTCGNPSCVNPNHIRWATISENNLDKINHGTLRFGSKNPRSKLSEDDVREIHRMRQRGMSHSEISRVFGINRATVSRIATGKAWKHIKEEYDETDRIDVTTSSDIYSAGLYQLSFSF